MTEDIMLGWVSAKTKPLGGDRKMLLRVVKKGWLITPMEEPTEIVRGEWRSVEGCFAFDKFDNANHLVIFWSWIDISEPTKAMIDKEFNCTMSTEPKSTSVYSRYGPRTPNR